MHIIHRGIVNKKFKENLLSSFKKSFSLGFGIETDIHLTKDGEFVCFHDFTLNRIFKKKMSIKNLNYSYLKKLSVNQNKSIPLLKDVLEISKNKYPLLIELKPKLSKKNLQKLIKETSKYSKCTFISFNHKNIFNLQKIKSNIKVGLSFSNISSIKEIINASKNKRINCYVLDKIFLNNKKIQNLKIEKYFYTIKKKSDFKKYNKKNNLIFENL
jgi:glycerophosphoryl diester phosphodiesterase|tara:strand:- start:195 stop:836 length:642 start_codon:yes stop_codon:yes gene_type:complete